MKEINEIKEKNYNDNNIKIESFEIINKKEIEEEEERKKEKEKISSMRINKRKLNIIFYSGFIFIFKFNSHFFIFLFHIIFFKFLFKTIIFFIKKNNTHGIFNSIWIYFSKRTFTSNL